MANVFADFIPLQRGQFNQVQEQPLISDLLGQVGYEIRSLNIGGKPKLCAVYTKDLTAQSPAINAVDMELIVSDFSQFGDYDILPLDADLEAEVLDEVVAMFLPTSQPRPQIIDPTSDTK